MRSLTVGELINAGLLFLAGLVVTFLAFRMGNKPGVDSFADRRADRSRRLLRICGPALMIFAVLMLVVPPAQPPPTAPKWRTVLTSDGVCSVEMPGQPTEQESPPDLEGLARPATQQWLFVGENGQVQYYLSYSAIEGEYAKLPPEELLDTIAENWFHAANSQGKAQGVSERKLSDKGWLGKELVIDREGQRMQNRWLVVNKRLYRAFVLSPPDEQHLRDAARFLDSFRVRRSAADAKES